MRLIAAFGDIGTVNSIASHYLSNKDLAIIAAVSVSFLFVSFGTAMLISSQNLGHL